MLGSAGAKKERNGGKWSEEKPMNHIRMALYIALFLFGAIAQAEEGLSDVLTLKAKLAAQEAILNHLETRTEPFGNPDETIDHKIIPMASNTDAMFEKGLFSTETALDSEMPASPLSPTMRPIGNTAPNTAINLKGVSKNRFF